MRLNRDGIIELRKRIKEEIEKREENEVLYLSLDDDILDTLMFDKKIDKNGNTIKYAVWTGKFLECIDLSNVDFSNVNWDAREVEYDQCNHYIDLSNTNARIDFNESYGKIIRNCNFSSGYVLIENIDKMYEIYNCNFAFSTVDFCGVLNNISKDPYKYKLQNCNLDNVCQVGQVTDFEISESTYNSIIGTNFTRTFIEFKCDLSSKFNIERLLELIKNDRIGDCYLNGRRIYTKYSLASKKEEKAKEYEKHIKCLVKSIFDGNNTNKNNNPKSVNISEEFPFKE